MNPELREFVLSLPLDVRQELAKCDGPFWLAARYSTGDVHMLCRESGYADERDAWLPVSPIAIALHAAKLAGRDKSHFVAVTVAPCHDFGASGAELATGKSWRDKANVAAEYVSPDDTAKDPTGHRAAIALLQKVMAEATS